MKKLVIILACLSLVSCAKKGTLVQETKSTSKIEEVQESKVTLVSSKEKNVQIPFKISLLEVEQSENEALPLLESLQGKQNEIANSINESGTIEFTKLSQGLLYLHVADLEKQGRLEELKNIKQALKDIELLLRNVKSNATPEEMRESYMQELDSKNPLLTNSAKTNLFDLTNKGRLDDYSGTAFFQLASHMFFNEKFEEQKLVVIYTNGHILPGRMIKTEDDKWELLGIETTVLGKGMRSFGEASTVKNAIVIDATHYALIQILKDRLSNVEEVKHAVLKHTEELYGFSFDRELLSNDQTNDEGKISSRLDIDFLSIGVKELVDEDKDIQIVDQLDADGTPVVSRGRTVHSDQSEVELLETI